jgi:hypothetical protein
VRRSSGTTPNQNGTYGPKPSKGRQPRLILDREGAWEERRLGNALEVATRRCRGAHLKDRANYRQTPGGDDGGAEHDGPAQSQGCTG